MHVGSWMSRGRLYFVFGRACMKAMRHMPLSSCKRTAGCGCIPAKCHRCGIFNRE